MGAIALKLIGGVLRTPMMVPRKFEPYIPVQTGNMAILPKKCKKRANFRTFFRKINFFKRRFPPFPGQLRTFLKNHSIGLETLYKNPNEGGIVGKVLGTPIFNGTKNTPKRNSSDFGAEKRKNETFDPLFLFFHAKERLFLFPMVFGTCASKFL